MVTFNSYKMSILPFANQHQIKQEFNKVFQRKFPSIAKNITLWQIRKLKHDLANIFLKCEDPYLELYSVCSAWVLFEKLVHKRFVKKFNRRVVLGICLLISYKNTQVYGGYENNSDQWRRFQDDLFKLVKQQPK